MSDQQSPLASKLFVGNVGAPYQAFASRDPYYRQMAELVVAEMFQASGCFEPHVLELGPGVGISTEVLLEHGAKVIAAEPNESMRYFFALNHMGDTRVRLVAGSAEEQNVEAGSVSCIVGCQMFHLLKDKLKAVLHEAWAALHPAGFLTLDLGPSNWGSWSYKLHDFRSAIPRCFPDELMTELSHPLYQAVHNGALKFVQGSFPEFKRPNLWAEPAKAFTMDELLSAFAAAGFRLARITETAVPIVGPRIKEFVRNSWTTWCRWAPLDALPIDEKLEIVQAGFDSLAKLGDRYNGVTAYHPTVIITAQKVDP